MDLATPENVGKTPTNVTKNSVEMKALVTFFRVLNFFMIFTLAWILVCMIVHGKRHGKWRSSTNGTNLHRGKIYIACVVVVGSCFPRLLLSQVLFNLDYDSVDDEMCEAILDTGVIAAYISIWLVYFFLWLRHRAIYAHPTVKSLMGRHANAISWILLVGLSFVSVGVLCGFTIPKSYIAVQTGCVIDEDALDRHPSWARNANYVLGCFLSISQASFVVLFVYPMILTKRFRNRQPTPSTPRAKRKQEKLDSITKTVYRSIIGASLTIVSDLSAAVIVALAIPKNVPRCITFTVYDLSIWINVFCIMATFGSNRAILFVFCRKKEDSNFGKPTRSQVEDKHTIGTLTDEFA